MIQLGTSTAIVALSASTALADVTAPDVWNGLSAYYQAFGLDVSATQTPDGDTLHIKNIKLSGAFPFDLGSITITTTGFDLTEKDDGTVALVFPEKMPLSISLTLPDDQFITAAADYEILGYSAIASGKPNNIEIGYSADDISVTFTEFEISDFPVGETKVSYSINGISGSSTLSSGDMFWATNTFSADKMGLDISYQDLIFGRLESSEFEFHGPTPNLRTMMQQTWTTVTSSSKFTLPASGLDFQNLAADVWAGAAMEYASTTRGSRSTSVTTLDGYYPVDGQSVSTANSRSIASISQDGIKVEGTIEDYTLDSAIPDLSLRLQTTIAALAAKIAIPLFNAPDEQAFTYAISAKEFEINEEFWDTIDPTGQLPRDPADIVIDISGRAKLLVDLFDLGAIGELHEDGILFAELNALTINELTVSAAGAKAQGTGAFTFDNADLETYGGLPAPSGTATFNIAGLNALMGRLRTMGRIDEDEEIDMRMGLSLLTVVGDGDDTLVSEIVVKPDGEIMANGKRLK